MRGSTDQYTTKASTKMGVQTLSYVLDRCTWTCKTWTHTCVCAHTHTHTHTQLVATHTSQTQTSALTKIPSYSYTYILHAPSFSINIKMKLLPVNKSIFKGIYIIIHVHVCTHVFGSFHNINKQLHKMSCTDRTWTYTHVHVHVSVWDIINITSDDI